MFARPKGGKSMKERPKRAYFASDFLEQMYERTPGVKSKFDGVALHPYTARYQELPGEIEEFRDVEKANGDSRKGLWITELGWSSQPPPSNPLRNVFAKGVGGQASQLKGAFGLLKAKQAKWRLQRIYWFSVDDAAGACNFCDGSGLFGEGFVPKKSWYAYVKFAGGTPSYRGSRGCRERRTRAFRVRPCADKEHRREALRVRSWVGHQGRNRGRSLTRWGRSARRCGAGSRPPSRGRRRPRPGGWEAISGGDNALICAPTGSGKTLASFLWGIDRLARSPQLGTGVRLVYVSPLKALSYDIERNLRAPLRGIGADISVGLRTGDTSQKERRAMAKTPPDILITTPGVAVPDAVVERARDPRHDRSGDRRRDPRGGPNQARGAHGIDARAAG